jgi:hypothetical protein
MKKFAKQHGKWFAITGNPCSEPSRADPHRHVNRSVKMGKRHGMPSGTHFSRFAAYLWRPVGLLLSVVVLRDDDLVAVLIEEGLKSLHLPDRVGAEQRHASVGAPSAEELAVEDEQVADLLADDQETMVR